MAGKSTNLGIGLLFLCCLQAFKPTPTSLCVRGQTAGESQVVNMQQQQLQQHQQQQQQQRLQRQTEGRGGAWVAPHLVAYAGKLLIVKTSVLLTQAADYHVLGIQDLPPWLLYDETREEVQGVPTLRHLGRSSFTFLLPCPVPGTAPCQPVAHVVTVAVLPPPPHLSVSLSQTTASAETSSSSLASSGTAELLFPGVTSDGGDAVSLESAGGSSPEKQAKLNYGGFNKGSSSDSSPPSNLEKFSLESRTDSGGVEDSNPVQPRRDHSFQTQNTGESLSAAAVHQETKQCANHYVASLVLCWAADSLNSSQRVRVVQQAAEFLSISPSTLTWLSSSNGQLHLLDQGYRVESGGASDNSDCKEDLNSELFWPLSCSAGRHVVEFTKILQHNVHVGRIQREVGVEVVGWYVASKDSKLGHRRRRRRAGSRTPIPTPTLYPPSATVVSSSGIQPSVEFTTVGDLFSTTDSFSIDPTASVAEQYTPIIKVVSEEYTASATGFIEEYLSTPAASGDEQVSITPALSEEYLSTPAASGDEQVSITPALSEEYLSTPAASGDEQVSITAAFSEEYLSTPAASADEQVSITTAFSEEYLSTPAASGDEQVSITAAFSQDQTSLDTDRVLYATPTPGVLTRASDYDLSPSSPSPTTVSEDQTSSLEADLVSYVTSVPSVADGLTRSFDSDLSPSMLFPSLSELTTEASVFSTASLSPTPALSSVLSGSSSGTTLRISLSSASITASESSARIQVPEMKSQFYSSDQSVESALRQAYSLPASMQYASAMETTPALSQFSASVSGFASVSHVQSRLLMSPPLPSSSAQYGLPFMPAEVDHPEIVSTDLSASIPVADSSGTSASSVSEGRSEATLKATDISSKVTESEFSVGMIATESLFSGLGTMPHPDLVLSSSHLATKIQDGPSHLPDDLFMSVHTDDYVGVSSLGPTAVETELYPSSSLAVQISASHIAPVSVSSAGPAPSSSGTIDEEQLISSRVIDEDREPQFVTSGIASSVHLPSLSLIPDGVLSTDRTKITGSSFTPSQTMSLISTDRVSLASTPSQVLSSHIAIVTDTAEFSRHMTAAVPLSADHVDTNLSLLPERTSDIAAVTVQTELAVTPGITSVVSAPSVYGILSSQKESSVEIQPSRTLPAIYTTPAISDESPSPADDMTMSTVLIDVEDSLVTSEMLVSDSADEQASRSTPRSSFTVAATELTPSGTDFSTADSTVATSISGSVDAILETSLSIAISSSSSVLIMPTSPTTFSLSSVIGPTAVVAPVTIAPVTSPSTTSIPFTSSSTTTMPSTTTTATPSTTTTTTPSTMTTTTPSTTTTTTTPSTTTTTTSTTSSTTTTTTSTTTATTPWWWTATRSTTPIIIDTPNHSPFVLNSLSYMTSMLGRYFERQIPDNMFYDEEDGSTRFLTLTLTLPNDQPLPPNFWVQLDPGRQMLMGLPLVADLDMGYHSVVVVATDSQGLGARNPINLYVNSSAFVHFTHKFIMKFAVEFGQFMRRRDNVMSLLRKLGSYFGDQSADFVTVVDVSTGSFVLSWTNSSLSGSYCQNRTIHSILNRMVRRDGSIRSAFNRHIGKKLKLQQITYQPDGACLYRPPPSTTPTTTTVTGLSAKSGSADLLTEIILPVLIALLLVLLIIIIALFVYRCRQQRGTMEMLDKDMYADRSPVVLPNEIPNVEAYNARPKKPTFLPYDQEGYSGSFPRNRPRTYEHYKQSGSLNRNRPNSYTFDDEHPSARPVTVIFNNFDSLPRQSRPPSYWNDRNEETPLNIRVPPPYVSTTSV